MKKWIIIFDSIKTHRLEAEDLQKSSFAIEKQKKTEGVEMSSEWNFGVIFIFFAVISII